MAGRIFTAAERAEGQAKARVSRAANATARTTSTLRSDFADADHWDELARQYHVRLPAWGVPMTPASIATWLHKLGLSMTWFKDWCGWRDINCRQRYIDHNKDWPLRAAVGMWLEDRAHDAWHAGQRELQ
jgi:hypothetical protein